MANIKDKIAQIRQAIFGKEVRESIASGIEAINKEVENTTARQDNVEAQFQAVLDETTDKDVISAPEITAARVGADNTTHSNLKARLDAEHNEVMSQLAQTEEDLFYNSVSATRYMKPCMTIIDDDAMKPVLTKLKPIAEAYNIPITLAVPTSRVDVHSYTLTSRELKNLHATGLFEIVSHTHTHPRLTEKSNNEIENELKTSREWIKQNGYNPDVLVYPFGSVDERVKDIVAKYYKQAVMIDLLSSLSGLNFPPVDSMELRRVYVENGVQRVKNQLDQIVNGGWVIVGTHCYNENFYPEDLEEIIDYAQSLGIDIVTMKEGVRRYGNLFEAGKGGSLLTKGFVVGADGSTSGEAIGRVRYASETIHADTPIYDIQPTNTITLRHYNIAGANDNNMPEGPGLLESYRTSIGGDGVSQCSFQIYRVFESGNVYRRKWNHISNEWEEWEEYKLQHIVRYASETIHADTPIYDIQPTNTITLRHYNIAGVNNNNMPEGPGLLESYRTSIGGDGVSQFSFQIYRVFESGNVYRRKWNHISNEWEEWEEYKPQYIKKIDMNVKPNTPYGLFPGNAISYKKIITPDADGFPENRPGTLTTYRMFHDYYVFQTYEVSRSHNIYRRYWNPDKQEWSEWRRLTPDARTLYQLNLDHYPKVVGDNAFATDLGKPVWWDGSKWVDANGNAV